jgi:hypothetical protein
MEHLRYVARSSGGDQSVLIEETAYALRGLRLDHAGLVVACRRITERHPSSGLLWWLCSHAVTATDPITAAASCVRTIGDDTTGDHLIDALPEDADVCVVGWSELAVDISTRRGDVTVTVVDVSDEGDLARQLRRYDLSDELTVVPAAALGHAVVGADVVVVEALSAGPQDALAVRGSLAAASVGYCAEVPVWMVAGIGRVLPAATFAAIVERSSGTGPAWQTDTEVVPLGLCSHVAGPTGVVRTPGVLVGDCPPAPELLRLSPM